MRSPVAMLLVLGLTLAAGCRSQCDLVEAELRTQESEVRELRDELQRSQSFNQALRQELHEVREHPQAPISPELASQMYTLKEVVLGRGTGGYSEDHGPDQGLEVVLEPHDPDGQAIKAPGSLRVQALQISPEGLKTPISTWEIPPDQLRRTWRNGLFSTGYFVVLRWQAQPASSKVRVVAQFTLADGRVFEADKDVTVRVPEAPPHPEKVPELPPPKPLGPGAPAPPPELEAPPAPKPLEPEAPAPPKPAEDAGPMLGWWLGAPVPGWGRSVQSISLRPAELLPPLRIEPPSGGSE